WVGVLLKEFVAIGFNNFLRDPYLDPIWIAIIALVTGTLWVGLIGGDMRKRLTVFAVSSLATASVLVYFNLTNWYTTPALGPIPILVMSAAIGLTMVALMAGIRNRRALLVAGINVAITVVAYFAIQPLLTISSINTILILAVATIAVGLLSGFFVGGPDRGQMMRIGAFTAVLSAGLILVDRFMQAWPSYTSHTS